MCGFIIVILKCRNIFLNSQLISDIVDVATAHLNKTSLGILSDF